LSDFDSLTRIEQRAFLGWFAGGKSHVTKYDGRDHVHMGKSECEGVDFNDFWLKKAVSFGWVSVEVGKTGVAIGMVGKPNYTKYRLLSTRKGFKVREAFWERLSK